MTATRKYAKPCRDLFNTLAKYDPERLVWWCSALHQEPAILTYAVESLRHIDRPESWDLVGPILVTHAQHSHPVVREAVIYVLADHADLGVEQALVLLKDMAASDTNETIRESAHEVLEDFEP